MGGRDPLDGQREHPRDTRRRAAGSGRSSAAGLEGVHGLTRHVEALREVGLRPAALGTEFWQAIRHHWYRIEVTIQATTHPASSPLATQVARSGGNTSAAMACASKTTTAAV